jgi:hypothetical protein
MNSDLECGISELRTFVGLLAHLAEAHSDENDDLGDVFYGLTNAARAISEKLDTCIVNAARDIKLSMPRHERQG